jgi:hypothetical protein
VDFKASIRAYDKPRFETQTYRLISAGCLAFRSIIPEPHDRREMTWTALPLLLYALVGLLYMAYLTRRPYTRVLRMLVMPTVILSAFGFSFGYVWTEPTLNVYNWGQCTPVSIMLLVLMQIIHMDDIQVFGQRSLSRKHSSSACPRTADENWEK